MKNLAQVAAMFGDASSKMTMMVVGVNDFLRFNPLIDDTERNRLLAGAADGCVVQITDNGYELVALEDTQ